MSSVAQFPTPFIPTESQLHMAYSVCRGITRAQAKNFYYGFLVLPKRKRQALSAVYAFMRRCDDIADDPALAAHLAGLLGPDVDPGPALTFDATATRAFEERVWHSIASLAESSKRSDAVTATRALSD